MGRNPFNRPSRERIRQLREAWRYFLDTGESNDMAKSSPRRTARKAASAPATPAPQYNPFLKPEHLSRGPNKLALTGWTRRMRGKYGEQIIVEVHDERERAYDFAINVGSPNHRILFKTFGANESQWNGTITVEVQRGKTANFIAILETEATNVPF